MENEIVINKGRTLSNFLSYFLVYSMLALQGMEYWFRSRVPLSIGLLFIVLIISFKYRVRIDKKVIVVLLPLVLLGGLRLLFFHNASVVEVAVNLSLYFCIVSLLGRRFWKYFCNLMVFFSVTSIFFWFLQTMGWTGWIENGIAPFFKVAGKNPDVAPTYNILIHNFFIPTDSEFQIRNSGPFWEPGLFAAYLCFAIFAERFFVEKQKNRLFSKRNLLMIAAVITTFSSAGYIALLIILLCGLFASRLSIIPKYLLLAIVVLGSSFAYNNIPFLKEKIDGQRGEQNLNLANVKSERNISRFAASVIHFEMLNSSFEYMLIGFDTIKTKDFLHESGLVSGLTQVFLDYGYPVGIYYYIILFMALWKIAASTRYNKKNIFFFFSAMALAIGFSQDLPTRGFYYFLIILAFLSYKKTNKEVQYER